MAFAISDRRFWAGTAVLGALAFAAPLALLRPASKILVAPPAPPSVAAPNALMPPAAPPEFKPTGAALDHDLSGVGETVKLYAEAKIAAGDAALATRDALARDAMDWVAVRMHPGEAGLARIAAFLRAHPDWPSDNLRKRGEELSAAEGAKPERAAAFLAEFPPISAAGRLAQAELLRDDPAKKAEAVALAQKIFRDDVLTPSQDKRLWKDFSSEFSIADRIYRLDRLVLREDFAAAARLAPSTGKDGGALYRAMVDLDHGAAWPKVSGRVPDALRDNVGLLYMRIHAERHADHIAEAVRLLRAAPRDPALLASPDDWWVERRLLARKLLDSGDAAGAYQLCAEARPSANEAKIEAEFHAGWIALRFLHDPAKASGHFDALIALANKPHSLSRGFYWRGRAAQASGAEFEAFYRRAAAESETFYGQLAREKLGLEPAVLRAPPAPAQGEARVEPVRAAEFLYDIGEKDAARVLALESASMLTDPAQMAALSQLIEAHGDAHDALVAGKEALHRGLAIDSLAFPLNGVPEFPLREKAAARPLVLAIARQESAFRPTAQSGAGAFGLMQMVGATARQAAQKAGLAYDEERLKTDAAFSAELGALHLGDLIAAYRGSHILAFAAYNAGGGNVGEWIKAYGDPRDPKVDPIDWIERIPFTETRNYVQRIVENLRIYRKRIDGAAADVVASDLRQSGLSAN